MGIGLLQPGFVRWAPPPASHDHFNHWWPVSTVCILTVDIPPWLTSYTTLQWKHWCPLKYANKEARFLWHTLRRLQFCLSS